MFFFVGSILRKINSIFRKLNLQKVPRYNTQYLRQYRRQRQYRSSSIRAIQVSLELTTRFENNVGTDSSFSKLHNTRRPTAVLCDAGSASSECFLVSLLVALILISVNPAPGARRYGNRLRRRGGWRREHPSSSGYYSYVSRVK